MFVCSAGAVDDSEVGTWAKWGGREAGYGRRGPETTEVGLYGLIDLLQGGQAEAHQQTRRFVTDTKEKWGQLCYNTK